MKGYPDSKHEDPKLLGELYQEKLLPVINSVFGVELHYYKTQEEQYTIGESAEGWEIKFDDWIGKGKNFNHLSIETGEKTKKSRNTFTNSGIFRKDNTIVYVQGNWSFVWFFEKQVLVNYYLAYDPPLITDNPPTIRKFYMEFDAADEFCFGKLKLFPEIKQLRYKVIK